MNDFFRIGISYNFETNKLKLYTSFEESDIIIASPLGLKFISKNDENPDEVENLKQKQSYDFLSSIEILLIDNMNLFLYFQRNPVLLLMFIELKTSLKIIMANILDKILLFQTIKI